MGCASEDCEGENRVGEGRGKGGLRRKVDKGTTREDRGKKKTMGYHTNIMFQKFLNQPQTLTIFWRRGAGIGIRYND